VRVSYLSNECAFGLHTLHVLCTLFRLWECLRREPEADRWLGLRFRIPLVAWMSVHKGIVCYKVEFSASG
jgi:hypothetical protein